MIRCPDCQQDVEPAPLSRDVRNQYFAQPRFCPTIRGLERCGCDLVNHAGAKLPAKAPKVIKERDIQRGVIRFLEVQPDVLVLRQSVGLAEHDGRRVMHGNPGQADLTVAIGPAPAIAEFWEIKREDGELRPMQVKFKHRCQRAGATYRIIRSVDEAREALKDARQRRAAG